jgi:hypothetical protein
MAEILPSGNDANDSSTFDLAVGDSATIFIRRDATSGPLATAQVLAYVQIKGSDNNWTSIGRLDDEKPMKVLTAVGTFRVHRVAGPVAFAVDKN